MKQRCKLCKEPLTSELSIEDHLRANHEYIWYQWTSTTEPGIAPYALVELVFS